MANDRISQLAVEVVILPTSQKARASQLAVEVVIGPTAIGARISQLAVEVLYKQTEPAFKPRVWAWF